MEGKRRKAAPTGEPGAQAAAKKAGRKGGQGQASHLIPTLEGLRNKLLDLTTRNNLLNLSLNDKRTRRLIRFVHSDLQGTLNALCSGSTLPLIALPDPPEKELREVNDDEFEAALAKARLEDPLYQQILNDSAEDKGISPALASAEDRLRSQVREELESSSKKRRSTPNLARWAEEKGISPSYELPCKSAERSKKSSGIQTLLLGARLERVAEAIRKQAASSIEETGNNILYLTFGGLTWNVKDKELFAPLILLPVEVSNAGARGGARNYTLRAVDDIPIENVTLRERLKKDFSVELPELDLQEQSAGLANYLEAVEAAISDNPDWSVRRFMNLSLFSFSGLGLYKDLDPSVVQHSPLVRQILSADLKSSKKEKAPVRIADDESVDKPEVSEKVPVLITQADASQFAAIADVMEGRSLVIEGPPGTGKSQTITNIIANALYSGKRVLFVAEKKVALDVVYTRLSEAGLKDYCLRIASDKVNKREVYNELAERLRIVPPLEKNRDSTADAFDELRDELNSFSTQLNRGFGTDRKSYQMLIWDELYLRELLKDAKVNLSSFQIDIENPAALTRAARDRFTQIFEQLAELRQEMPLKRLADTFFAINELPADVLARERLVVLANDWHKNLDALLKVNAIHHGRESSSIQSLRETLSHLYQSLTRLPDPIEHDLEWLIEQLSTQEMQAYGSSLLSAIAAERSSREKLQALFNGDLSALPSSEILTSFFASWRQWRLGDQGMPQTMHEREALSGTIRKINEIIDRIQIVISSSQFTGKILGCSAKQIESLLECIQRLAELPKEVLRTRQSKLWSCDASTVTNYLKHHDELKRHSIAIGVQDSHPILSHSQSVLLKAASDLEQAEALGYSAEVASSERIIAWRSRSSKLVETIERIDAALDKCSILLGYQELTIGQLVLLPDVLRDLKGLALDIRQQRDGTLWSSSLSEVSALRSGMEEIQQLESDLRSQSLVIPSDTSFYVLQSAAKKIETTPWLLQAFDGEYSKAIERAKRLGAKGSATQQAKALRRIAQFLQLREKFPANRFAELSAASSSFEESAQIIERIEGFKSSLHSQGMIQLLDFFKNTNSAEVDQLLLVLESSASANLAAVLDQAWLGINIGKTAYEDLKALVLKNRDELTFIDCLYPFIEWHGQAEGAQQSTPREWIRAAADYVGRLDSFPSSELLALTENQCTLEEAIASLQALKTMQNGLGSWRSNDEVETLIRSISIADIEPLLVLLRDQLWPSLCIFLELIAKQGVDIANAQVDDLLESAKQSRQGFLDLIQRHAELGIINDLSVEDLVSAPIDLLLHQKREEELQYAIDAFKQCGGDVLGGVSAQDLQKAMAWLEQLHNSDLPVAVVSQCLKPGSGDWIRRQSEVCNELSRTLQQEAVAAAAFIGKATAVASRIPGSPSSFDDASAEHLCKWLSEVSELSEHLTSWIRFQDLLSSLPSDAERQLAHQLLDSTVDGALWPVLYRWNVVRSRLSALTVSQPQLSSLRAADQVARRKRFAKTEDDLRRLDRAEVIAAIHNDPDDCHQGIGDGLKADFTEMALIRNESVKRIKHRPLRHLFQYAGNALRGLKPCWMMSPATVASLLPRGKGEDFDLVVIDEASQMSPERALGVISRAKQCVVVGDPQQLPPTSLFQRNTAWEDSDDADEIDIDVLEEESILDLSSKAFQPTRRLKWHYRSRNGSLIAFSNKHFYDSQLVVFPACRREFAITRHLVEEPRYKKGVNEPEVRDACDIVIRQLELYPERSLGVVAMNEAQADAIAEQLDDLAFHHDELRRRLDLRDNSESLFVKPLEKVQGDERDTIVISTTYGPSEPGGTIPLRFGLLNRASGHRRLNVLFTRAKHAIELVTSLKSSQLRLPATAGPGLLAFRDYLRYVEKGSVDSESGSVREPTTPFEKLVFGLLHRHGFTADCGVGFSNYFIDLAVRHPDASDHYLLALEGDGNNYNSARAARDRDKYRQAVLEALGWNVYKVWSTDWFDNPEGEIKKLLSQLKRLRKSVVIPCDRTEDLRARNVINPRPRDGSNPREATGSSDLPEPDPEPEPVDLLHSGPLPPLSADPSLIQPPQQEPDLDDRTSQSRQELPPDAYERRRSASAAPPSKVSAEEAAGSPDSNLLNEQLLDPIPVLPGGSEIKATDPSPGSQASTHVAEPPPAPSASRDATLGTRLTSEDPGVMKPTTFPIPSKPTSGCVVQCRSHRWLVEEVEPAEHPDGDTVVRMACLDDDANGQRLEVFWEREVDAQVLGETTWDTVGQRGFDDPQVFGSYLNTLRWNCVTSTDPGLFQAPLRAGIDVKPYQLEPLRKALRMPRVSLFIADDVGLGKTIEAGLIMRELLLRQKVHRVVVVAPPSVVLQWKGEMESRFGLSFAVMDRQYITEMRRQRGWGINPWATHTRFIISQALVRDEAYAGPLRDWLGDEGKQALLILDEAHNAAPASGSKFAIDSKLTRAIRDQAGRFEHKLFLSATPHNGHSNSFSALLEILDPTRFCRGVPVRKQDLEDVMVRRLKEDLRQIKVQLPERLVVPEVIDGLPADTPEIKLAELLSRYRELRNQRLVSAGKRERAAENLVISNLQKRLLSSIAAFDRTLRVHMNTLEKRAAKAGKQRQVRLEALDLLQDSIDGDDDRAEIEEQDLLQEADAQHEAAVRSALEASVEEWKLLRQMQTIAEAARYEADSRVKRLEQLIRQHLCTRLGQPGAEWAGERLLIFTEYADTKDWLERRVRELIAGSDQAEARIATFHGGIGDERREAIKRSFNSPPDVDPLRILIATDAAREGVNLQNHCRRLVHFDVPWNPGRMEQRNGRIDRTLQRAPQVYCHYFVLPQRPEDTVLDTVVRKTDQIRSELGCLPPVVIRKLNDLLAKGINPTALAATLAEVEGLDQEEAFRRTRALLDEELEGSRERKEELENQVGKLERALERSTKWLNFSRAQFRNALNTSLQLNGNRNGQHSLALIPRDASQAAQDPDRAIWEFPSADELPGGEAAWGDVLDALRPPRQPGQKLWQWRKETQLQPVVFQDPQEVNADRVHLHLEHPLVMRLLNRFLMRGFQSDALSRAAVLGTTDDTAKLIVLARLSLYGHGAARLHDEVLAVVAEWDPADPNRRLRKLSVEKSDRAMKELEASLQQKLVAPEAAAAALQQHLAADVGQLRDALDRVVDERRQDAALKLAKRAEDEVARFVRVLEEQRKRILSTRSRTNENLDQLLLDLGGIKEERRQLEDNRKYWEERLQTIDSDLEREPERIRRTFALQTHRVEPAGAIYLWPQDAVPQEVR